jgi:hypothetical protein
MDAPEHSLVRLTAGKPRSGIETAIFWESTVQVSGRNFRRFSSDGGTSRPRALAVARSTRDLLNVLHEVAQSSAAFKSLHDHWADTTTPHGRLMLTILGGLAEFAQRRGSGLRTADAHCTNLQVGSDAPARERAVLPVFYEAIRTWPAISKRCSVTRPLLAKSGGLGINQ